MSGRDHADGWNMGYDAGYEAGKAEGLSLLGKQFATEWGHSGPWGEHPIDSWGIGESDDYARAAEIVGNMGKSGYEAHVIWRGVTDWHRE